MYGIIGRLFYWLLNFRSIKSLALMGNTKYDDLQVELFLMNLMVHRNLVRSLLTPEQGDEVENEAGEVMCGIL